jgi:sulfate adenylyltransferase
VTVANTKRADRPLVDVVVDSDRAAELNRRAVDWPNWYLSRRQLCDLELLACGGFTPLETFLNLHDYESVCATMRLADGTLWPVPVTLDIPADVLVEAERAGTLALREPEGAMLAALEIHEAWRPDLRAEAAAVFGTIDDTHPGVEHLLHRTHDWYVSGDLQVLRLPEHPDLSGLRQTPAEVRAEFARRGWVRVVAFQTRNPMHRAHQQLTVRAARQASANLLIHPVVGIGKPGDVDVRTRVSCYRAILPTYPENSTHLSLLPLAMRMAGPREALWHAIIRRNYGATHFIVGRDHAGPGLDSTGQPFYHPYDAQRLLATHADEVGIDIVPFRRMMYVAERDEYRPEDEVPVGSHVLSISGTELRERLDQGAELPSWFTPPEVAAELQRRYPPRADRGFTIFLTGLSGSGKSTVAARLRTRLLEHTGRAVSLLDGDIVRRHLSPDLDFSREDRDRNVHRIGFVAAEVTKHRGIAICAPIAPFDRARREVRRMVEDGGGFLLVYLATPLDVCEVRDHKGLYAKARAGVIPQFTGVSDPYEVPTDADVVIDTRSETVESATQAIIDRLIELGYLNSPDQYRLLRKASVTASREE